MDPVLFKWWFQTSALQELPTGLEVLLVCLLSFNSYKVAELGKFPMNTVWEATGNPLCLHSKFYIANNSNTQLIGYYAITSINNKDKKQWFVKYLFNFVNQMINLSFLYTTLSACCLAQTRDSGAPTG